MIELCANLDNVDWSKGSWDLLIGNIDDLLKYIKSGGWTPDDFMKLPVYRRNVNKLPWLRELEKRTSH